ncbi:hypothetical protein [Arcobacter roscoffensis]|uniref:Uncharacterized protein n=1 Tax=Arcobacter roscoffensis TaxID=2961520 RepID=A0ABY5E1I4_9BACT|nr:hypothetical protein [Arcobacter roscoffensis]UTJ05586.1 hypothetical protein NJU99_09940 [Arcobacter roscoffensis]
MTQTETSKYLDIPLTTLNDWKKEDSNRYKLYQLLISLDKSDVVQKLNKKVNHRVFSILNRNIDDNSKSTFDEIRKAFSKKDYHAGTIKEQTIYSKFFKELEVNELEDFVNTFNVSKRDIKSIYISSPFRNLSGVAKNWDKRFRLKHLPLQKEHNKNVPSGLQSILNKKS